MNLPTHEKGVFMGDKRANLMGRRLLCSGGLPGGKLVLRPRDRRLGSLRPKGGCPSLLTFERAAVLIMESGVGAVDVSLQLVTLSRSCIVGIAYLWRQQHVHV